MMTQTIRELLQRKSIRSFTERPVSADEKALILRAACAAPTAGNQQLYTIIDVTDQALKEQLVKTCDNQPFIASAPLVLIFCADCRKWYEAFLAAGCEPRKPRAGDLLLAVSDANIAAQNAVAAAESLGIGSCYIGDVMENCERQRELLHLPKYVFPAAMLVFGYPSEKTEKQQKPERAPLECIVSENAYPQTDAAFYKKMVSNRWSEAEHEQSMEAFCRRKYNSDFSVEMSRSVEEYLKDFAAAPD